MRKLAKLKIFALLIIIVGCGVKNGKNIDWKLNITVGTDPEYPEFLSVTFENSLYRAVIRVRERKIKVNGPYDHCIREWIIKSINQDQVKNTIDGSAHRSLCQKADIIFEEF